MSVHLQTPQLGAMIRARMSSEYGAMSALARAVGVTVPCIFDILAGKRPGAATLARIGEALNVLRDECDRWHALAGHVAPDVEALLLAHPERWGDVRRMLGGES